MSNTQFVILPSNTKINNFVSDGSGSSVGGGGSSTENRPNKFKVILPRKLTFDSGGTWLCGLHSIVYPNR